MVNTDYCLGENSIKMTGPAGGWRNNESVFKHYEGTNDDLPVSRGMTHYKNMSCLCETERCLGQPRNCAIPIIRHHETASFVRKWVNSASMYIISQNQYIQETNDTLCTNPVTKYSRLCCCSTRKSYTYSYMYDFLALNNGIGFDFEVFDAFAFTPFVTALSS